MIERPKLTLPGAEAAAVAAAYAAASVILEYGSGGSTVLAAEMPGKTVFSVESDAGWLGMMRGWFADHPPLSDVHLHHGDIGPTGKWGKPLDESAMRRWPDYALGVWDLPTFRHPDVVLVDGRFRPACLLATLFRISRPVTVLFDDYEGRDTYRAVEDVVRPTAFHGRMAQFDLEPSVIPAERLAWVIRQFLRPL